MSSLVRSALALSLVLLACPASAQTDPQASHWGVQAGFDPRWQPLNKVNELFPVDVGIQGQDIRIGAVRGSVRGGDWGVTFVRGSLDDESFVSDVSEECSSLQFPNSSETVQECGTSGKEYRLDNTSTLGVEVHWFKPFARIARRIQIGMNAAVGAAWLRGTAEKVEYGFSLTGQSTNGQITVDRRDSETRSTVDASEAAEELIGISMLPTGRLELAGAVILSDNAKLKVGGGIGFPGYSRFNVSLSYFIGAR